MSLGIDDDWSGLVEVLKDEFGEGGQARSMENSIIRTSLKSVKGSQREEVVQLFNAFALVRIKHCTHIHAHIHAHIHTQTHTHAHSDPHT